MQLVELLFSFFNLIMENGLLLILNKKVQSSLDFDNWGYPLHFLSMDGVFKVFYCQNIRWDHFLRYQAFLDYYFKKEYFTDYFKIFLSTFYQMEKIDGIRMKFGFIPSYFIKHYNLCLPLVTSSFFNFLYSQTTIFNHFGRDISVSFSGAIFKPKKTTHSLFFLRHVYFKLFSLE